MQKRPFDVREKNKIRFTVLSFVSCGLIWHRMRKAAGELHTFLINGDRLSFLTALADGEYLEGLSSANPTERDGRARKGL